MPRTSRGAKLSPTPLDYILLAQFNAPDQGYANGQVLDHMGEGCENGQLTVVEVDGTLAISGNKCAFTAQGTPIYGDLGVYSQALSRSLGLGILGTINVVDVTLAAILQIQIATDLSLVNREYYYGPGNNGNEDFYVDDVATTLRLFTMADATDYQLAVVLGGYLSGVPWYQGQDKSLYIEGASFFISGGAFGSNWHLLWRTAEGNTTPLYAAFSNYNAAGTID